MAVDPVLMWLIVGAGLIVFEVATSPGLGLFLAGLGGLTTAVIIKTGLVDPANMPAQFAWFFGLTTLWTIGLWKPLLKFRKSHNGNNSVSPKIQDIVGSVAVVGKKGLKRGVLGQAHWSGTVMSAKLDASALEEFLPEGNHVLISSVTGTVLNVIPTSRS